MPDSDAGGNGPIGAGRPHLPCPAAPCAATGAGAGAGAGRIVRITWVGAPPPPVLLTMLTKLTGARDAARRVDGGSVGPAGAVVGAVVALEGAPDGGG